MHFSSLLHSNNTCTFFMMNECMQNADTQMNPFAKRYPVPSDKVHPMYKQLIKEYAFQPVPSRCPL